MENNLFLKKMLMSGLSFLLLFAFLVTAANIITSTSTNSINESNSNSKITVVVNNTDIGVAANITRINVTLPNNFTFVIGSNVSANISVSNSTFSNTSSVLSWLNNTAGYFLINGSNGTNYSSSFASVQSFSFNVSVSYPGTYNITVSTFNATAGTANSTNISITVNDTTAPIITFVTPQNNYNISGGAYAINITTTDYSPISSVYFNITNSTGNVTALKVATNTSTTSWNASLNTTLLADGLYNVTVIANDSLANTGNSSVALNVRVDNTVPVIDMAPYIFSKNELDIYITAEDGSGAGISTCTLEKTNKSSSLIVSNGETITDANLNCGNTYYYQLTCNDSVGNEDSISKTYSTNSCGGGGSGGSTSSSSSPSVSNETNVSGTQNNTVQNTGSTGSSNSQENEIDSSTNVNSDNANSAGATRSNSLGLGNNVMTWIIVIVLVLVIIWAINKSSKVSKKHK